MKGEGGQERRVDVRISPLRPDASEGGGLLSRCVLVTIQDVASLDLIEGRALRAARMECVGKLAGGLAHRLNNLLTGIIGYTDLVRARLRGSPDVERDLEQVRSLAGQVQELTAQLLAFGGRQKLSLQAAAVQPPRLVRECARPYNAGLVDKGGCTARLRRAASTQGANDVEGEATLQHES